MDHGTITQVSKARAHDEETRLMAAEVCRSLTAQAPWIPCKYFYDDHGSQLFDQITELPEYYPTRTEERLLESIANDVIARARPTEIVELGSGAGRKIRLLLREMQRAGLLRSCTLFDINEEFLTRSAQNLAAQYPGLDVRGVVGDFTKDTTAIGPGAGRRMVIFLAGTIGNFHPEEVSSFLARIAASLAPGDSFLIGIDLVKDTGRLEAAYNDTQGVTAEFNLNILTVLNRRLGANFDLSDWRHVAFYDREHAWIEMRLRAARSTRVQFPTAGLDLSFREGDEIRTEISCKYTPSSFKGVLPGTGLEMAAWYTDPEGLFALTLLTRTMSGVVTGAGFGR